MATMYLFLVFFLMLFIASTKVKQKIRNRKYSASCLLFGVNERFFHFLTWIDDGRTRARTHQICNPFAVMNKSANPFDFVCCCTASHDTRLPGTTCVPNIKCHFGNLFTHYILTNRQTHHRLYHLKCVAVRSRMHQFNLGDVRTTYDVVCDIKTTEKRKREKNGGEKLMENRKLEKKQKKICAQCCCCSVLGAHIQKCCQTLSVWRTKPRAKSERNGIWHVCNCADTIIILLLLYYIHIVISALLTMAMHNDDEVTAASHHTLINKISHFLSICLCIRIRTLQT